MFQSDRVVQGVKQMLAGIDRERGRAAVGRPR